MNFLASLLNLSIVKTERYFACAKSVLACSQKSAYGGTSFLTLRDIFTFRQVHRDLFKKFSISI
ncbi:hypothetical protein A2572_04690 [Candidatus Collierbacteria bacterium RIFOXYD1_FULL_40_9]|uniref:Uncharacterized protein n=1 Tax=Candidatus Collierbacteria bacterium RIFOXYD1_FULL_40_9 TaxID=1817731 RepID=A0A1F5FTA0_9BACT|nr:MAG: hypothetical protein A2572_04690 [Candidatus Collierbacteria bacterium RIFOXYD1_FULL_40_9]